MKLYLINKVFGCYNFLVNIDRKIRGTLFSVYRVCSRRPTWYILDNGQFVDSSYFDVIKDENYWTYDGSVLVKNSKINPKKLPYLSLEFQYNNNIVNMDDFIECTKFQDTTAPPLPVIMSAFSIYNKILHPWFNASFTIYNKMGDKREFFGSEISIPE